MNRDQGRIIREELESPSLRISPQAREMIGKGGPVGRRLDFWRRNSTARSYCCSSRNDLELTNTGLEMKNVVEQFREPGSESGVTHDGWRSRFRRG